MTGREYRADLMVDLGDKGSYLSRSLRGRRGHVGHAKALRWDHSACGETASLAGTGRNQGGRVLSWQHAVKSQTRPLPG